MDDMYFLEQIYDILEANNNVLAHDNFLNYLKLQNVFLKHENFVINNYYNYVGEIFDENNRPVNIERDKLLQNNYKSIMKIIGQKIFGSKFYIIKNISKYIINSIYII